MDRWSFVVRQRPADLQFSLQDIALATADKCCNGALVSPQAILASVEIHHPSWS